MSSATFEQYMEEMNRQLLDKKPDYKGSGALLPHQRTAPINTTIAIQDPKFKSPQTTCIVPKVVSNGSTNATVSHHAYLSPKYNQDVKIPRNGLQNLDYQFKPPNFNMVSSELQQQNYVPAQEKPPYESPQNANATAITPGTSNGLAKSRWADPNYYGTSVGKFGFSPVTPSMRVQYQPRGSANEQVTNHLSYGEEASMPWTPVEKYPSGAGNETSAPNSGPVAPNKQDDDLRPPKSIMMNPTQNNGLSQSKDVETPLWKSGRQPSAAVTKPLDNGEANGGTVAPLSWAEAQRDEDQWVGDTTPDPRGNWPTKSYEGGQEVMGKGQGSLCQGASSDEVLSSMEDRNDPPQYLTDFIQTWVRGAHVVKADFTSQDSQFHEECDINTYDGRLIDPVIYPRTRPQELMSRDQSEMTSANRIREYAVRKGLKNKMERKAEGPGATAKAAVEEIEPVPEEVLNTNRVRIPCHLRPAVESDIEAITAIYNREVENGYNSMDSHPVKTYDFQKVYNQCQTEKMPFVVAIEGQHGVVAYPEVLGFALITAIDRGISGSHKTLSAPGGKMLVIVKEEYRRKKIGTALMDIIMANCTGWYIPKGGYQFVNSSHGWISSQFGSNPRKWWYIEMEIKILSDANEEKTRRGAEFQWIWNFLEVKFDLILKHYDEKCCFEERYKNWLDKLTFRRACRSLGQ
ncbi:hypothetical protein NUW58_g130 [Xylaria curta]|uniref:Uncharacterized protein n=1 Tax=Xylaria curta TaxID=42375 RepID=A0ACC1PRS9_9PEZI|nr:hypothetical protein NUW58_g130 [Xylaria curta]